MESVIALLAPLVDLVVAWGPYVLVAYGIFTAIVLVLVVAVFVTVLKGFWTGRYQ